MKRPKSEVKLRHMEILRSFLTQRQQKKDRMMDQINDISRLIGGGCGAGGYVLDEKYWAVRTFAGLGRVKFRNRTESNMKRLFPGQLLYGVLKNGQLIGIDVAQDGSLVPRNPSNRNIQVKHHSKEQIKKGK